MIIIPPPPTWQITVFNQLLGIRPAQLGAFVKVCLGIRRRVVATASGLRFWADPVSVFGLCLLRDGVYEPHLTRICEHLLRPGDVVVDVGGNEGYFSILAAALGAGRVICVEPQTRLHSVIAENSRLNGVTSIVLAHALLADSEGSAELFLRPSTNTGASSMFRHWRLGRATEHVSQTTLDALLDREPVGRVRLIKCDCEGAEYLVARGASATLRTQRSDMLVIEYHPAICGVERCAETHSLLRAAGYWLTKIDGHCLYYLPSLEHELHGLGRIDHNVDWSI